MAFTLLKALLILAHITCFAFWVAGSTAARVVARSGVPGQMDLAIRFRIWAAAGAVFAGPLGLGLVYANWNATSASVWVASLLAATFWLLFLIDFIRRPAPRPADRVLLEKILRLGVFAATTLAAIAILSGAWLSPPPYVGIKFLCFGAATALMVHAPEVALSRARSIGLMSLITIAAFMGVWRPILIT